MSPDELAELRELEQLGTRVEIRIVADDRPIPLQSLDSAQMSRDRATRRGDRCSGSPRPLGAGLMVVFCACRADPGARPRRRHGARRSTRGKITVSAWQAALIALGYYLANIAVALRPGLLHALPAAGGGLLRRPDPGRSGPGHAHRRGHQRPVPGLHLRRRQPARPMPASPAGSERRSPSPATSTRQRRSRSRSAWACSARSSSTAACPSTRSSPTGPTPAPRRPTSAAWR